MKDPFSAVQDLMHHCSLDGFLKRKSQGKRIHGMAGVIVVLEKPWKCSLQQFNSSRTTLCERNFDSSTSLSHKRWRMEESKSS